MKNAKLSLFLLTLLAFILSGCAKEANTTTTGDTQSTKIYVGTQNDYPPFCYTDENNNLTGFDIEVIKIIDQRLEDYEFEFVAAPWDSIFLSLESNKVQIVADEIAKNPEREEKYLFSDEAYFSAQSVIIVKEGRTDIKSIDDLAGLKVASFVGDSYSQILENYNATHDEKIEIVYGDSSGQSSIYREVESGRVDAYVNDPIMSAAVIKDQSLKLVLIPEPVQFDSIHLVFRKDDAGKELKTKVDTILKALKEDGTLNELSKKWTDGEYIPK